MCVLMAGEYDRAYLEITSITIFFLLYFSSIVFHVTARAPFVIKWFNMAQIPLSVQLVLLCYKSCILKVEMTLHLTKEITP